MGTAAETLSHDKESPSRSPGPAARQAGGEQHASGPLDAYVDGLFDGGPTSLPGPAAGSLTIQRLRAPVLQRSQRFYGNQASQNAVLRARTIQRHCACGGTCTKCQEEEQQRVLQRSSSSSSAPSLDHVPAGPGEALGKDVRQPLEAHFGADLSEVRVHRGRDADQSARQLDALAYTSGRDIYFASGMYSPASDSGKRLLAHEVAHVVQQGSGREPTIATKSAHGVKIGAPDDGLEVEAEQSADEYMRGTASQEEARKKLAAPESQAPIQRAPDPTPDAPKPAADPDKSQTAVDAICKGIEEDDVGAVVASMGGLSLADLASVRRGVLVRKFVLLERWLLKSHESPTLKDIAMVALIGVPTAHPKITATAEQGMRLLLPALPLIDRIEIYDEGYREIEQAQLDVIRQSSLKERADTIKNDSARLFAVYEKMSAKEEFDSRNVMDPTEVGKGDTAVRMIQRGDDKDVVYDALMALDRIDRKFVWDQHYDELYSLLDHDQFKLVAALTHGTEAQLIIARLRLATDDRSDDMDAVRATVDRAVELLSERQQLREARSAKLLTEIDRANIDERLEELGDLDELLQFRRDSKGNLKENTFMALLADAENTQAAFGAHMNRLQQFAGNRKAFAFQVAKQRIMIAGSNQDALTSILLTTHAPPDPNDKTKRSESKQREEDEAFRKKLIDEDPQVHSIYSDLKGSEQVHVRSALKGDAFNEALDRLNQLKNTAQWGEFFALIRTVALNPGWRERFLATRTEYWSLYAFVSGEEREIMEKILYDPEHKMPIITLLRYTGKVSTLKAAFANLQESDREQLRTGWAMANHPFIGPHTEQQDGDLAAFKTFEDELNKSQGSDHEGYQTILTTVLGTAPTKSEMATGQGRYNAAAILAERVTKRLNLERGMAADFTETDETMDAAGRQFAALWIRLKDQPELSIVEYATLLTLYQQFDRRADEFSEAAKSITDIAGTIAATLAGIIVVVATGGAATPAVIAMAATAGAAGGLVAREAFGGDYYTAMSSDGARALLLDSINGALAVLSSSLAAKGVELMGLSGEALAQGMVRVGDGAVQQAASSLGRKALVSGVEAALDGMISGMVSEAAATFTDDRTWREGIMEGLSRVGKSAVLGGLFGMAGGAILGSAMPVVGRAAGRAWKAVTAGTLEKTLIRAGMQDVLKAAQAAARSGDTHAVEMMMTQMEASLGAEEATILRKQFRDTLEEAIGRPPGRADLLEDQQKLLMASGEKETGLANKELEAELDVVTRSEPQVSTEPGYVDEVDLGNGHIWRRKEDLTWCRFSNKTLCGTKLPKARKVSPDAADRAKLFSKRDIEQWGKNLDKLGAEGGEAAEAGGRTATVTYNLQDAIDAALKDMKGNWGGSMSDKGTRFHAKLANRIKEFGLKLPSNIEVQVEQKLKNVFNIPKNIEKKTVREWLQFEGKGGGRAHEWLTKLLDKDVLDTAVGELKLDAMFKVEGQTIVFDLTSRESTSHLAKTTLYSLLGSEDGKLSRVQEYYWAQSYAHEAEEKTRAAARPYVRPAGQGK